MAVEIGLTESGDRRRRSGDLWLNREDVRDGESTIENGSVVDLVTDSGHFRGRGFYNERTSVAVRVVSNSKTAVNADFFRSRIQSARRDRSRRCEDRMSYRVVHGDGDYLPGLVVDRYGDYLVVQFRHPTIEGFKSTLVDVLEDEFSPRSIYCRNDFDGRQKLGLESYSGLLAGEPVPDTVTIRTDPFELVADLKQGQKTGFYLDQCENRRAFACYLSGEDGLDGLDCFSYTGAWGLETLAGGAESVTFVDTSEDALDLVRENLRLNGWSDRAEVVEADGFDYLNDRSGEVTFDFIALDPPAFAHSPSRKQRALDGYKEINLRSMTLLKEGGLLATSTCSSPVTRRDFLDVLVDSADDAHVSCRILEERRQGPDHPWLPKVPSTLYLQSIICEISLF